MSSSIARLAKRIRGTRFTGLIGQNGQTLMRITMDLQDCGYQVDVQVESGGLRMPMRFFHEFVADHGLCEGPSISVRPFAASPFAEAHALYIQDETGHACVDTWEEWGWILGTYRRRMMPLKAEYNQWVLSCPTRDEASVRRNLGAQLVRLIEQECGMDTAYELMNIMVDRYPVTELVRMIDDRAGLAERVQQIMG